MDTLTNAAILVIINVVNAMILAAGLGTRLGELGKEKPKVLFEVQGKTLLDRHLDFIGIQEDTDYVLINCHHQADQIKNFVDDYNERIERWLDLHYLEEFYPLGTAGGIWNARSLLNPPPFLVVYGDTFFERFQFERTDKNMIAVYESDSAEDMGIVEVEDNRVISFIEKGLGTKGLVNAGIYILQEDIISLLRPYSDFGYDIFPKAIEQGIEIYAQIIPPVVDIGTPERLKSVQ